MVLRDLISTHPPHSVEALTRTFLADIHITEQKVRELAHTKRITLSAVVRGLMCNKYPELKQHWPLSKQTPAQIEGIAKRSRSPDGAELKRALELLSGLLSDRHNMRTHNAARTFLAKHGIAAPDWREEYYKQPKGE
jgi:hypothetical protein